jgi:hypothetical protein
MGKLLYHEGNKGGGIEGWGECYSYSTINPPLTLTGQKPEYARLLDIALHAYTILCNLDSLGIAGSLHLGVIESALCLQCQGHVWLPRPEITKVSHVGCNVQTPSPRSHIDHGTVSSDCDRTFMPTGVEPRNKSAPLSWMSFFRLRQRG